LIDKKKNKIGLLDIKNALNDGRFRDSLPLELRDDVAKWLQCPSCGTHVNLYRKIAKDCKKQLSEYFPGKDIFDPSEDAAQLAENHWLVINCHVDKLETELRKLPKGRKQIAIARFEDQATVVVNELDYIF
jgi:hypothetical protein